MVGSPAWSIRCAVTTLYAGLARYQALTMSQPDALRFAETVLAGRKIKPVCAPAAE